MKFKDYEPPKGGLQNLRSRLDELEIQSSPRFQWKIALPSAALAATIAFVFMLRGQPAADRDFINLISFYAGKNDQWSAASSFKEISTGSSDVKFYWYENANSRQN